MVKSVMHPGERARARVAVRFPHEGNAAGYAFVTDQRVMFAFLERVVSVNLPYVVRLGRPAGPTLGDFEVVAQMPGPHAGYVATTMRVRDHNAFHGFFPTLLDAVRANGAQPEVDASWGGDLDERSLPVPDEAPSSQVMDRALARFMKDRERIVLAVELVHNVGGRQVTVMLTQQRLIVVEGAAIWAATLSSAKSIAGSPSYLRLLVHRVSESIVVGGGLASIGTGERRLTLRSRTDTHACERIHAHLAQYGGGVLEDWPSRPALG
jgi:hypothetical protein